MGPAGVEPAASRLSGVRSNHLSYGPLPVGGPAAAARPWTQPPRPGGRAGTIGASHSRRGKARQTGRGARSRKEVIQPHLPVRLPCYDLAPVVRLTLGACPPCGLARRRQALRTPIA